MFQHVCICFCLYILRETASEKQKEKEAERERERGTEKYDGTGAGGCEPWRSLHRLKCDHSPSPRALHQCERALN